MTKTYTAVNTSGIQLDENIDACPKYLLNISRDPDKVHYHVDLSSVGAWMTDAIDVSEFHYLNTWALPGYNGTELLYFKLFYNSFLKTDPWSFLSQTPITLPYQFEGTGHTIYNHTLYYIATEARVVKYDLTSVTPEYISKTVPDAVSNNGGAEYTWGFRSDLDLAVDEYGLWVTYGTKYNMRVGRLDPGTLNVHDVWQLPFPKRHVAESFMVCGMLYMVDNCNPEEQYIKYVLDTTSGVLVTLPKDILPFPTPANKYYMTGVSYNPRDRHLYAWNNDEYDRFPLSFTSDEWIRQ